MRDYCGVGMKRSIFGFRIDAVGKIWSKSDKWLWRYYMTFVAMTKNTKNYAQSESNSCHTADTVDNWLNVCLGQQYCNDWLNRVYRNQIKWQFISQSNKYNLLYLLTYFSRVKLYHGYLNFCSVCKKRLAGTRRKPVFTMITHGAWRCIYTLTWCSLYQFFAALPPNGQLAYWYSCHLPVYRSVVWFLGCVIIYFKILFCLSSFSI